MLVPGRYFGVDRLHAGRGERAYRAFRGDSKSWASVRDPRCDLPGSLQGAASQAKFAYLAEYLESQRFYYPEDPVASYREIALLYFRGRRAGVTVRSASDHFIARVAIEHDLVLLHNDSDFENMARVIPELTLA